MNQPPSRSLESEGLAFFGIVTASISHELKNVAAFINESAGLLHDLSVGAQAGRKPLDPARVMKLSADIVRNVERSVSILNRMNRFAHSVDEPKQTVDLFALCRDTMALAARAAVSRGIELIDELPNQTAPIPSFPFGLYRLLYQAIQIAVLDVQGKPSVHLSATLAPTLVRVQLRRDGSLMCTEEHRTRREAIEKLMQALGGCVRIDENMPDAMGVQLELPTS